MSVHQSLRVSKYVKPKALRCVRQESGRRPVTVLGMCR